MYAQRKPFCPECGHTRNVEWVPRSRSGMDATGKVHSYLARVPVCRVHGEFDPNPLRPLPSAGKVPAIRVVARPGKGGRSS